MENWKSIVKKIDKKAVKKILIAAIQDIGKKVPGGKKTTEILLDEDNNLKDENNKLVG